MLSTQPPIQHCNCCGLSVGPTMGDVCPRCGYPIKPAKEMQFLQASIRDLQRVATHGGAKATVEGMVLRYQDRLNFLRMRQQPQSMPKSVREAAPSEFVQAQGVQYPIVQASAQNTGSAPQPAPKIAASQSMQPVHPIPPVAQSMFSLRSFLADQTINIVSTLGAFLILIGSLSYVITTTNLLLSFLVLFFVHIIFAAVGFLFHRFANFRLISRIYLAIFALLVPLVDFSGYRLVSGNLVPISTQTVIAIAAAYAAIVYAALAITQQFKPFGYLAGIALVVADVACANALHLLFWWYPVLLAPIAFVGLLAINKDSPVFSGNRTVLREPMLALMYLCIGIVSLSDFVVSFVNVIANNPSLIEPKLANVIIIVLTLAWTGMFWWTTKRNSSLAFVPYQFLGLVVALAFLFNIDGYVTGFLFASVAAFYQMGRMFFHDKALQFRALRGNALAVILTLVVLTPIPFTFNLLDLLHVASSMPSALHSYLSPVQGTVLIVAMYLVCSVTIVSIVLYATGLRRIPDAANKPWSWLLLLSALLFIGAYSESFLLLGATPFYAFLAFTLILLVLAIVLRSEVSAYWAYPLEVFALFFSLVTLYYQHADAQGFLALVFLFVLLSYSVLLYQRRDVWLFIPFAYSLLTLVVLPAQLPTFLVMGLVLPMAAVVFATVEWLWSGHAEISTAFSPGREWPLLAIGLVDGVIVVLYDGSSLMSTMQRVAHIPFPFSLELACFALLWYVVAILTRKQAPLVIATGFAFAALLVPSNPLWFLVGTVFVMLVLAVGIERLAARIWATPLYLISLLAAVLLGSKGYTSGQLSFVSWLLLGYAVLLYAIGVLQNLQPFIWVGTAFAIWGEFDVFQLGNIYSLFFMTIVCALAGVGVGYLVQTSRISMLLEEGLRRFSLPFYSVAFLAMILTGLYGTQSGISAPFPYAIPGALLIYALVCYAVITFEQQRNLLWLVIVPSLWGIVLVLQWNVLLVIYTASSRSVDVPVFYLTIVAFVTTSIGLLVSRANKEIRTGHSQFSWNWPWYVNAVVAVAATLSWNTFTHDMHTTPVIVYGSLFVFMLLALGVTLVERRREPLLLVVALILWAILQANIPLWQQLSALSVFCFLLFVAGYVFHVLPTRRSLQGVVYVLLIWLLPLLLLLIVIGNGGQYTSSSELGYTGIGILVLYAVQLFWLGYLQRARQPLPMYLAGLCIALAVSWELLLLNYTRVDLLTVAPATYLVVISPFLSRDAHSKYGHLLGQISSILGALLLLLPTLWLSFNDTTIVPTVLLAGEASALLLLGVVLRTRIFVLSGTALIIISAIHVLFLPTLGLSPSLALTITGVVLLAIATFLSLARHRVQSAWKSFDGQA